MLESALLKENAKTKGINYNYIMTDKNPADILTKKTDLKRKEVLRQILRTGYLPEVSDYEKFETRKIQMDERLLQDVSDGVQINPNEGT